MHGRVWTALVAAATALLAGCFGAEKTVTPASVAASETLRLEYDDGGRVVARERSSSAQATGAGLRASGDSVKDSTNTTAPEISVGKVTAGGGGLDSESSLLGADNGKLWLWGGCVVLLACGGVLVYFRVIKGAVICFALAGALFVSAQFPAVMLVALLAAAVGGGVYVTFATVKGKKAQEEAAKLVRAIANLPDEHKEAAKAEAAKLGVDQVAVARIKAAEGI